MIIIITGPLGVGKTEVSWQLNYHFERAVMLDGDYIGAVQPFEIYDQERIDYLYKTIHHLVAFHVENGYHNFVINYVFEAPESLAQLCHLLTDLDDEIYAFRLVCDVEEMERRVRGRAQHLPSDPESLTWELNRFRQLITIQRQAAERGDMGFVIDTTGLSVMEVARAIWDNVRESVDLLPYDPHWPTLFETERTHIQEALGDLALEIHHIGSTAVPGLDAKPVIDILVVVRELDNAVDFIAPLQKLGYAFIDYPQNTDRRFFRKGLPRTHHLHIVQQGSDSLMDHLDFRDALRDDPRLLEGYQEIKRELSRRFKNDRALYSESKTNFVNQALADWRGRS